MLIALSRGVFPPASPLSPGLAGWQPGVGAAGAAPLVIATGGVNRHDGIIEGREFARQLTGAGVPADVIRVADQSKDTWQNVELSLPIWIGHLVASRALCPRASGLICAAAHMAAMPDRCVVLPRSGIGPWDVRLSV